MGLSMGKESRKEATHQGYKRHRRRKQTPARVPIDEGPKTIPAPSSTKRKRKDEPTPGSERPARRHALVCRWAESYVAGTKGTDVDQLCRLIGTTSQELGSLEEIESLDERNVR